MDYCENMRQMIGNSSLIIVRPSVAIVNKIKELKLFGVYSGKELINRVEESGDEYQTVAIGYLCTKYEGEITPESNQGIEAQFFGLDHLPDEIDPFTKDKLVGVKGQLEK